MEDPDRDGNLGTRKISGIDDKNLLDNPKGESAKTCTRGLPGQRKLKTKVGEKGDRKGWRKEKKITV